MLAGSIARADDTEIFVNQGAVQGLRPNIVFIIDTSGSMDANVDLPKAPYNPGTIYDGECDVDYVYFAALGGGANGAAAIPRCDDGGDGRDRRIEAVANKCDAAATALGITGLWTGKAAQWVEDDTAWGRLGAADDDDEPAECEADAGVHGENAGSDRRYARNGNDDNLWTDDEDAALNWGSATVFTFYSANWLNWYFSPNNPAQATRLQVVQAVAATLASSIDGVNLGLMRFSNTPSPNGEDAAEGGMVTHQVENIADVRATIIDRINSYVAQGVTPLSETLYETQQYYAGRAVDYGVNSTIADGIPFPSVPESRSGANNDFYKSPITLQCPKNYSILLTDGEPSFDSSADERIRTLPGFSTLVGADCDGDGWGRCLDDVADYMFKADLSDLPGKQSVVTYTIGFGPEVGGSEFLERVATRGGGRAFAANDVNQLTTALQQIVSEILQSNATFTAPAVSVNAFNRTQTTNSLYVSLFEPSDRKRWLGNVKKYGIRNGEIVDALGRTAVDSATGFFRDGTQSLWSPDADGNKVTSGGAISRQPEPGERKLFTYVPAGGNRILSDSDNSLSADNAAVTAAMLGITGDEVTREQLLAWLSGVDVNDADADGDRDEARPSMGDPLHARPTVVTYGGTGGNPNPLDTVVYAPTNDGFLHAIDANTGEELWAFMPPELLGRVAGLYANPPVGQRSYGLDGDVRLLRFDGNQDGVLDAAAGDRAFLYFGMRRGGRHYYAIDVTNRNRPRLLWNLGATQLPGIGETWSPPTLARVNVGGATQNGEKIVLVMGGGYDDAQENYDFVEDNSGHRVFMIDAVNGNLLWYAGGPGGAGTPDLALSRMRHSIPSRVSVIDLNGDQFADRMYVGDMGGRVWRFDIFNGNSRGSLVTGGVFATLGNGDVGTTAITSNRRFYNAPDVALIQRRGTEPYFNIAIGSGYRGHPLHVPTRDRLYALRDRNPFAKYSQADYNALTAVTDGALVDITDNGEGTPIAANALGWKLELRRNGGWVGEKVLADAITINGTILFTTYQPVAAEQLDPCLPANGRNRVYALKVDNAAPAIDFDDNELINANDASRELATKGIAGEVSLLVESTAPGEVANPGADALGRRTLCVVGVEVLQRCVPPGSVVRTYWQRDAASGNE
jgi:type IV pilus assembly protein PilY1